MGLFDIFRKKQTLNEELKQFETVGEKVPNDLSTQSGEGISDLWQIGSFGKVNQQNFHLFHNQYINYTHKNEYEKIIDYRNIAKFPEIASVLDDAIVEMTELDSNDQLLRFDILDESLSQNENMVKNLNKEFDDLFFNRIRIQDKIYDFLRTLMIDGRVYYERVINEKKKNDGIQFIKKLPSQSMDYNVNELNQPVVYFQYLKALSEYSRSTSNIKPRNLDEAKKDNNVIVFNPEQIGFINSGRFGSNIFDIIGYLENAKAPFNQLKMLETSIVIYRLIRSPERLVFKIDVGNMPVKAAYRFVEEMARKMNSEQKFNTSTGKLQNEAAIVDMLSNYYIPVTSEGRGANIESIGGNPSGFAELDDLYYFQKKLYQALKYPISRIESQRESRSSDIVYPSQQLGTIARDEIKWAKFLEGVQNQITKEFKNLFLLHLDFKGLKKSYGLDKSKFRISMEPPNKYKENIEQQFLEAQFNNFSQMVNYEEIFSKTYLMKKYLNMTDEEIEENYQGFSKDKELKDKYNPTSPGQEEGGGFGF